jgi:hypothetical protein
VNAYSNSTTATTRNMNGSDVNVFMNTSESQPNPPTRHSHMQKAPTFLQNATK